MSDSVRPHRRQPTRLPRPWDSLGKNTGMGCHSLLGLGILPAHGGHSSFFFTNAENFRVWAALIYVTTSLLMRVWLFPFVC